MGIGRDRCREVAFMVAHGLDDSEVVRLATGLYALFRVVKTIRFSRSANAAVDIRQLFKLFAKKALNKVTREIVQASLPSPR